jgi:hypothetical protein
MFKGVEVPHILDLGTRWRGVDSYFLLPLYLEQIITTRVTLGMARKEDAQGCGGNYILAIQPKAFCSYASSYCTCVIVEKITYAI